MGYQSEREQFIRDMGREFPAASMADIQAILRAGTSEHRWNETTCSINIGERETARQEKRSEARTGRVRAIVERLGGKLIENGDPRGYAYYIACPSGFTGGDWGRRGIGVPGRGLPARCFQ